MPKIKVELNHEIIDGQPITFVAPCDCSETDGLRVGFPGGSKDFVFKDSHGNDLSDIGELFSSGAYVRVLVNTVNGYAYIQNADTNAYLESQLANRQIVYKGSLSNCSENDILEPGGYSITTGNVTNVTDCAPELVGYTRFLIVFNADTSNTRVLQLEARTAGANATDYANDLFYRTLIKGGKQNQWRRIGGADEFAEAIHKHTAGDITSGKLSLAYGGTGQNLSNIPKGAVVRNSTDGTGLWYVATKSGAFYATGTETAPKFGALPVAQGGTDATTPEAALANLGGVSMKTLWKNGSSGSAFAAQTLTVSGLSDCSAVIVNFHATEGSARMDSILVTKNGHNGHTIRAQRIARDTTGTVGVYELERAFIVSFTSGKVEFKDATQNDATTNTRQIPFEIIGIKGVT